MNSDMSFEARKDRALNQLGELIREYMEYEEPTFYIPKLRLDQELDLLSDAQISDVTMYFILDEYRVSHNPFGEFAEMSEPFHLLGPAEQDQVIKFYNMLLQEHGLVLNWYGTHGQNGGYRFELDFYLHPAAIR